MDGGKNRPDATPSIWSSLWITMRAACCSGVIVRLFLHPLDTAKARLQIQTKTADSSTPHLFKNLSDVVRTTVRQEGIRGLYRGFVISALGSAPAVCVYITSYEASKNILVYHNTPGLTLLFQPNSFTTDFTAGFLAEVVSCLLWVPIDVVKERLQIQRGTTQHLIPGPSYIGTLDTLSQIWRSEGLRGIYRGYGATLASFGPFSAIFFAVNETAKSFMANIVANDGEIESKKKSLPLLSHMICGAVAGATASLLTNPLDLVKLRLQVQRAPSKGSASSLGFYYRSFGHGLHCLYRDEGVHGLLRGAGARMLFHAPSTALTFAAFEYFRSCFH